MPSVVLACLVDFDGVAEGGDGFVQILLVVQGEAEVAVGEGVFGLSSMAFW
jgi:hypothetical protein